MLSNSQLSEAKLAHSAQTVAAAPMQTLGALVFGVIIIFAVGFIPVEAAHNFAHDTRHALAFPCH